MIFNAKTLIIAEKPSVAREIAQFLSNKLKRKATRSNTHIQLGDNLVVTHCVGHLLSQAMPEAYNPKYASWRLEDLPIFPQEWKLEVSKNTAGQYKAVASFIKDKSFKYIIHAGDPDREGQLLVDELFVNLKINPYQDQRILRVMISDLTPNGLDKAFRDLLSNQELYGVSQSAFARAHADWLLGMNLSRAATIYAQKHQFKGVIRIGRVMSPVMQLIWQRQQEIENFVPHNYYQLYAQVKSALGQEFAITNNGQATTSPYFVVRLDLLRTLEAQKPEIKKATTELLVNDDFLARIVDEEGRIVNEKFVEALPAALSENPFGTVTKAEQKTKEQRPPLGLSLHDLQTLMYNSFGVSIDDTLQAVQNLYERKVVTYPRTDSNYFNETDFNDRHKILANLQQSSEQLGVDRHSNYFRLNPEQKSAIWQSKKVTNHSALAPTTQSYDFKGSFAENMAYKLIAQRYLMQFMPNAEYADSFLQVEFEAFKRPWAFTAKSSTLKYPGWKFLSLSAKDKENLKQGSKEQAPGSLASIVANQLVANINLGDPVEINDMAKEVKLTSPPSYFNEASLLTAMTHIARYVTSAKVKNILNETDGLGTEATRAAIIKKLFDSQYCYKERGKDIKVTPIGQAILQALPPEVTVPDTTALWELSLKNISQNQDTYQNFMANIQTWINQLLQQMQQESNKFRALTGLGLSKGEYKSKGKKIYRKKKTV
ncbi:hypothetical protein CJP74_02055 [Psittacicella melopsittaci]|uniref:DNA topoisomerase n=1 Tax=Psittacicella melopsittaci TaxID=2028576 RepID=A0A3A1YB37_9GAMM|nr:DNA topoisomerase III [Psittacicella melopsittaci]RIY33394.1 hypothetical protein CJP74_02055 [Psittacicella melopsittaci]